MQTRALAPDDMAWWRPPAVAPDLHGPVDVPFQPVERSVLERPVFALLSAIADAQPQALALAGDDRSLSYAGFRRDVEHLAGRIAGAVPMGRAVAVLVADGIELAIAMLACLAAGRVCLMISIEYPEARILGILADAAAGGIVVRSADSAKFLPAGLPVVAMDAQGPEAALAPTGPDDPALVIYTSGSTGQPKGIVRSHRQVLYLGWNQVRRFHLSSSDRVLSPYTLTTGGGLVSFMMTLMAGAAFHPMNVPAVGARAVLERARREQITLLTGTPSLLRLLFALNADGDAFASLRALYTTGESLLAADLATWRRALREDCAISYSFGMGEAGAVAGWFPPRDWSVDAARLPIGYPNPDYEYAIRDEVLWIRSPLLSLGEWRDGGCVPGRLLADRADPTTAVFSTGDVIRRRDDGLLEFFGRADSQVKIRGNRVEPAELENLLLDADGVTEAAVLTRKTGDDIELVAFVVGGRRDALVERIHAALPTYMHPAELRMVDRLPRTPTGKVDLRALEATLADTGQPRWRRWLRR